MCISYGYSMEYFAKMHATDFNSNGRALILLPFQSRDAISSQLPCSHEFITQICRGSPWCRSVKGVGPTTKMSPVKILLQILRGSGMLSNTLASLSSIFCGSCHAKTIA